MDSPGNPVQTPILFISGLELRCAVGEFAEAAVLPPLHWSSLWGDSLIRTPVRRVRAPP